MPQMMPLNWLILFIYFIMVFLMFNILNFYSFIYKIKLSDNLKNKIKFNWKW
uniref:ATP synthase complex subunit 8 n=1 Tax=Timarcha goettingensis TaxID=79522 RepID=A0A0S2MQ48_9CUCU|nr:ATP synthase F0 subunit 8 [Timarcha goettingensis]